MMTLDRIEQQLRVHRFVPTGPGAEGYRPNLAAVEALETAKALYAQMESQLEVSQCLIDKMMGDVSGFTIRSLFLEQEVERLKKTLLDVNRMACRRPKPTTLANIGSVVRAALQGEVKE